ncbi:unnamed protein product [Ilex paraguariensis]|uniref:MLO-like protein n=1 Tax=Ilex paraguariensis TaxID=185542 RepID=A0ABC8ULG0_9AQUA
MLPCKMESVSHQTTKNGRRLLSENIASQRCAHKGKVPLLSIEALHQLHIFIFVMAVVHAIFCATTMVLGGAKIRHWKNWEDSIRNELSKPQEARTPHLQHHRIFSERAGLYWRRSAVVSWLISFLKQFYGSVTKSDYIALRSGFIRAHIPSNPEFDFHKYMVRTLAVDFKKIVGISWYLWLFVVAFLLLNIEGWHTYFWLSFVPLLLLLLVGAKLEHIITHLAEEAALKRMGP